VSLHGNQYSLVRVRQGVRVRLVILAVRKIMTYLCGGIFPVFFNQVGSGYQIDATSFVTR
jgi:hypothetical protein